MSEEAVEISHEALARRRGEGFVAACTCGWFGHDVRDRREATRAALEHEMRAAQKRERLLRVALERDNTEPSPDGPACRERPEPTELPAGSER